MLFVQDFHDHHIVGYESVSTNQAKTISTGAVFTPVSGAKTFQLKEWKPNGVEEGDNFQLLSVDSASTCARYSFISKAYADWFAVDVGLSAGDLDYAIGWWIYGKVDWEDAEGTSPDRADTTPITVGDSFLVACGDTRNFSAQSAGQVQTEVTTLDRKAVKTPFFCNYLPVDVKLANITVDGVEEGDNFQILSSSSASTIARYCYISKAYADWFAVDVGLSAGDLDYAIGWWIYGKVDWEDAEGTSPDRANNIILGAGQGILVAAGDYRNMTISFPSSLEATK